MIHRSVPNQPQMNDRAEHFNQMINTKSKSMRHQACFPLSWWEFSVLYALYLYNRTPVCRVRWVTPAELVTKEQPDTLT